MQLCPPLALQVAVPCPCLLISAVFSPVQKSLKSPSCKEVQLPTFCRRDHLDMILSAGSEENKINGLVTLIFFFFF